MTKTSKVVLAILGVLVLAAVSGWAAAGMRGSGPAEAQGSFLQKIRDAGELRVGVAVAPPMTVEEDGVRGGPNLIPLENLAEEMGVELVTVPADWGDIVAGLQADRFDVAAYLDATLERSMAISFSDPVFDYEAVFLVEADSPYSTTEDLLQDGGAIAVAQGTAYERNLQNLDASLLSLDNIPNAVSALQSGRAIAAVADYPVFQELAQQDENLKIIVPEPSIYAATSNYGLPVDIDPHSRATINIAIANARNSGEMTEAYREVGFIEMDEAGELIK